jgi:hypothetical protein
MEIEDAEQRSSKGERSKRRQPEGESGSVGTLSRVGALNGDYKVGTSRKDSDTSNTLVAGERTSGEVAGEAINQLIDETEKQLAYYEQQAEILRDRLEELRRIPGTLTDIEKQQE